MSDMVNNKSKKHKGTGWDCDMGSVEMKASAGHVQIHVNSTRSMDEIYLDVARFVESAWAERKKKHKWTGIGDPVSITGQFKRIDPEEKFKFAIARDDHGNWKWRKINQAPSDGD